MSAREAGQDEEKEKLMHMHCTVIYMCTILQYMCTILQCMCTTVYTAVNYTVAPLYRGHSAKGHLSNEDPFCSPNHIELCTNLPLN